MTTNKNESAEFQKFLLFRRKAEELDTLNQLIYKLVLHTHMGFNSIRKMVGVSPTLWEKYRSGSVMLPDGFMEKFKWLLKGKLEQAADVEFQKNMDWYFDFRSRNTEGCMRPNTAATEEHVKPVAKKKIASRVKSSK